MIRKITLFLFLFLGLNSIAHALVRDTVTIHLPPFRDTTCVGTQLMFTATTSSDTFTTASYKWFTNSYYTGVTLDTFYTTALGEGDSVFCVLYFVNSAGVNDSDTSNIIIVHHAASIPPNVLISLTTGSNPDCAGHALTFTAYPINGGTNPQYQWYINGVATGAEDSVTISRFFDSGDTLTCRMISNSPCAPFDTIFSAPIVILHTRLTESVTIAAWKDTICYNTNDTFTATAHDYGTAVYYQWYVNNMPVFGAVNQIFVTHTLNNGDSVYCVISSPDTCVLNRVDTSNGIKLKVNRLFNNMAYFRLSHGTNPGCLDSPCSFQGVYDTFGVNPLIEWRINGVLTAIGSDTITRIFNNGDLVSFNIYADSGCYNHDSIIAPAVVMIRDSTPPIAPRLSLIGDLLSVTDSGLFVWYFSDTNNFATRHGVDSLIPGVDSNTFHPLNRGYYYVRKINGNCPSLPSNIIYISLLGIKDVAINHVNIFPNPTNGKVVVDWGILQNEIDIDVYDALGRNLAHEAVLSRSKHETDLSSLPDGSYYMVLRDENGNQSTHKISLLRN